RPTLLHHAIGHLDAEVFLQHQGKLEQVERVGTEIVDQRHTEREIRVLDPERLEHRGAHLPLQPGVEARHTPGAHGGAWLLYLEHRLRSYSSRERRGRNTCFMLTTTRRIGRTPTSLDSRASATRARVRPARR